MGHRGVSRAAVAEKHNGAPIGSAADATVSVPPDLIQRGASSEIRHDTAESLRKHTTRRTSVQIWCGAETLASQGELLLDELVGAGGLLN